jgi:RHS repeat-associated protein
MIKGGVTYRILTDHLGSPRLVMDVATGTVAQRMDYDEFGRVLLDTNPGFTPFGFAGGLYDRDTGLVRLGARDYDPHPGQWTAKDPILFAGGINVYEYCGNDPVNYIDSTGMDKWRAAQRLGQTILNYGRRLTRKEALEARKLGQDVVTDSMGSARKLEKDVSRALGGNEKAVCDGPHGPGQLPHAHAQHTGPRDRFPGHSFVDGKLPAAMPMGATDGGGSSEDDRFLDLLLDLVPGPIMFFPSSAPPEA